MSKRCAIIEKTHLCEAKMCARSSVTSVHHLLADLLVFTKSQRDVMDMEDYL